MTSPAVADLWSRANNLPLRERIIAIALFMAGTTYDYGNKTAKPSDGILGITGTKIDCSGFIRAVYDHVFPLAGLGSRTDLNALKLQTETLFEDTTTPQAGDLVLWDGHVGIVCDPKAGTFIGAQTSTGVQVASYKKGYWATTRTVKLFRRWKTLRDTN